MTITPLKVIHGHQFWYEWKAGMQLPISESQYLISYLAPFSTCG